MNHRIHAALAVITLCGLVGCKDQKTAADPVPKPPVIAAAPAQQDVIAKVAYAPPADVVIVTKMEYPADQLNEPKLLAKLGAEYLSQSMTVIKKGTAGATITRFEFPDAKTAQGVVGRLAQGNDPKSTQFEAGPYVFSLHGDPALIKEAEANIRKQLPAVSP